MTILVGLASILGITLLVYFFNRLDWFKVCPICAGVFLTWAWMLLANFAGQSFDIVVIAMLMGGSGGGITYTSEKRLRFGYSKLLFKSLFIPIGFFTVTQLIYQNWVMFLIGLILMLVVYFI